MTDPEPAARVVAAPATDADPRVAARWDETARLRAIDYRQGWLDSQLLFTEAFQARVSGAPQANWIEGLMTRAGIPRGGRWASLGCGAAGQEIIAARLGLFASLAGYDASPESLDLARRACAAEGLRQLSFAPIDLDGFELPAGAFDVVLMNMSLHHVRELGAALGSVRRALAPGGALLLNEFVGPRQFQFPAAQVATVAALLAALPERLRRQKASGTVKREYAVFPVEHWDRADPSEAIRSDRILAELESRFEIAVRIDYGGTILNLLLEQIVHNFDEQDEKDAAILRLLAACEAVLVEGGFLDSDFTAIAARPLAGEREMPAAGIAFEARPSRFGAGAAAREIDSLRAELAAVRSSRGWRLVQALRGLVGRRW